MTVGATALRANRDFRLLWIGQSLSSLGGSVSGVAFPLLVLTTTGSATKAGLVGLAANAPFVLLQLPLGAYVDRWNRRAVMLCADVGHAVALGSLAVALAVDHLAFGHIVAVAPLETSFFVAFRLAEGSSAAGSRPGPGPVGCGIALNQARSYGTSLAGDPLGGLLFGIRSLLPFAVDAISTIASLITIASVRTPLSAPAATGPRHLGREIREGLTAAWSNTFLRTASPLTAGSDVVLNGLFLITLVIATRHGASPAQVGVMLAIGGTGGMLGALTASALARRVRSLRLVVAGVAWVAVPLILLMAATTNPLLLGILLGLTLSVWPLYNAIVVARRMTQIPDRLIGRVQGAVALLGWAPVPLAPLLGGVLIERIGETATVLTFAAMMLTVALAATTSRQVRGESATGGDLPQGSSSLWELVGPAKPFACDLRLLTFVSVKGGQTAQPPWRGHSTRGFPVEDRRPAQRVDSIVAGRVARLVRSSVLLPVRRCRTC